MKIEELARKYALINALEFSGKANVQAVIGKIIKEDESLREKIKDVAKIVAKIVKEVNALSLEEQKKEFEKLGIKIEKKEEKKELPDLPLAEFGKVITAFPPEPSKYPHLGHAKAALINYVYAKKYGGMFILRFEDTNPELAKKEYYDAILDGLKWLGIEFDKIDYISDHIERYYEFTEKLIKEEKAYVCLCKQEEIKKNRANGIGCEHREQSIGENLSLWKKMFNEFKEKEATVRLRIDMNHKNTTMRDPSIIRIIDKEHPRTGKKYRLWPTYDFGTSVMDGLEGVTHRFRSKEFEMRDELQKYIQKLLGFKQTYIQEIARFNLEGVPSSGRIIRQMIAEGQLYGWDDPRLTTLMALKRRGFLPEALKEFLLSTGISKSESTLTWEMLESFNRKYLDQKANRYFAVVNPVKIEVNGLAKEVEELLHPDYPERGKRKIIVSKDIYIEKNDYEKYFGNVVRLIGLGNIKLGKKPEYVGNEILQDMPKIHWVSEPFTKIKIMMNDGKILDAIAEPNIKDCNDYVQFVRFGFAKLDSRKDMFFYYTHR
ncbi:MAG: glutamate--tRNA ligase [Candidatus Aenigmarchaeota archaeon]|nr:glutamate--tRNA ligase [Candidatus Aenigmarchaeota archaeon]MBU5689261.1 glutamate--tRNA ligase [Candidatus Aenigmarchaeota archaeon]